MSDSDSSSKRYLCKTALTAFVSALLTTPVTTLLLLQALDRPGNLVTRLLSNFSYHSRAILVGLVLVGLPVAATLLAVFAIHRVNSAWTPVAGSGLARSAFFIGIFSTLTAAIIFLMAVL